MFKTFVINSLYYILNTVLDIVQSFLFTFLLYCESHEHVYIYKSKMKCSSSVFVNIIKIRDSSFSLFTWYQSQRGKLNFFSVTMFSSGHFILLLEPSAVAASAIRSPCC